MTPTGHQPGDGGKKLTGSDLDACNEARLQGFRKAPSISTSPEASRAFRI